MWYAGRSYGFVRYFNVRDVCKLLTFYFGNFKIIAKVAWFDKAATKEVEKGIEGGGGVNEVRKEQVKGGGGGKKVDGEGVVSALGGKKVVFEALQAVRVGDGKGSGKGAGKEEKSEKVVKVKQGASVKLVDTLVSKEDVRVGDVMVRLGKKKPT